jgi:hypothetical protein
MLSFYIKLTNHFIFFLKLLIFHIFLLNHQSLLAVGLLFYEFNHIILAFSPDSPLEKIS